jgi:hypothetical protein
MSSLSIFGLGVVAGIAWCFLSCVVAYWHYRAKSHRAVYGSRASKPIHI